jgi:four helix bundle protein
MTLKTTQGFKDRTIKLVAQIVILCTNLPKDVEALKEQALRSAVLTGVHYNEAQFARTNVELIRRIGDAKKELSDTAYLLELLAEAGLVPVTDFYVLNAEIAVLISMIDTMTENIKARVNEKKK